MDGKNTFFSLDSESIVRQGEECPKDTFMLSFYDFYSELHWCSYTLMMMMLRNMSTYWSLTNDH